MSDGPSTMYHGFFCGSASAFLLVAVGRGLLLWVKTCRSSRMCSDTTCPIKPKFLQLKRRSSGQVSFFEGFPVQAGWVWKVLGVSLRGRCFRCMHRAVNGTGLLPTPPTRQSPGGGLPPGVNTVLAVLAKSARSRQEETKRSKRSKSTTTNKRGDCRAYQGLQQSPLL